ncbi:MAG: STAS domain-containing protein [Actinomycetota bacterium]|jgi:anti-anti-sigma regulatory factor
MLPQPEVQVGVNVDRTTTVRIAGEVGTHTLETVKSALDEAGGTGLVIIDLTRVTHLDAPGVDLLKEVAGERGLEVVMGPDCPVFSVVQVSGLCEVATVQCH